MTLAAAADLLRCPKCAADLQLEARVARCVAGHSYDVARQGYLNLLGAAAPANADTAEMVAARDRFLSTGAYLPIINEIAKALAGTRTLLDAGTGTGWYAAAVLDELPDARAVGTDVSVAAARRAARVHARLAAVVADTWRPLPVRTGCMDAVMSVFAPRNPAEFARVLRPGGLLVVAAPLPEHLQELRAVHGLLEIEPGKKERLATSLGEWFRPAGEIRVTRSLELAQQQVADVIAMGPNAFHRASTGTRGDDMARSAAADSAGRQAAAFPQATTVTLAVEVSTWRTA